MSGEHNPVIHEMHLVGLENLRKKWSWFVGVGVALIVLGTIALGSSVLVTLTTMVLIGWLMVVAGVVQTVHGFANRDSGGFFIDLLAGILSAVTGILIVGHPGATAGALTIMITMLLIVGGIFRISVALSIRFLNTIWLFLHGVLNLALAGIILQSWPDSGLWVIGTFIAVDMIFNGWTLVMLGLAARRLL